MGERRAVRAVSVIDIGSNFVRMGVYQARRTGDGDQRVRRIDFLEVPLRLGHEVFAAGRISLQTMRRLSAILRGFSQVMKEYGVTEYRAIATTAVREAQNRAYVIDQLRIQNGLVIEVLEDGEESALVYSALCSSPLLREETLLSYVGTGCVGLAVWRAGVIDQSYTLTQGFLKLSERLRAGEEATPRFYRMLEEYIQTYFYRMELRLGGQRFSRVLLAGRQLETIASLCGARPEKGAFVVERAQLEEIYTRLKETNPALLARDMDITEEMAEQIAPMLAIYRRIMDVVGAKKLVAPPVNLMEVFAAQLLLPAQRTAFENAQREGAIASSRRFAEREGADIAHAERVRTACVVLFGKLKKLHGISGKRLVLLECAALLHEVGYRANVRDASQGAYDLIRQSCLYGLSDEETRLVAEIIRKSERPAARDGREELSEKQRLLVDKLAAIMGLADALDTTRQGRAADVKARLEEQRLVVTVSGRGELLLEKWTFQDRAAFFEETFGVQPVLVHKSTLFKEAGQ